MDNFEHLPTTQKAVLLGVITIFTIGIFGIAFYKTEETLVPTQTECRIGLIDLDCRIVTRK